MSLEDQARAGRLEYPVDSGLAEKLAGGSAMIRTVAIKEYREDSVGNDDHDTYAEAIPYHMSHPGVDRLLSAHSWRWPRVFEQHVRRELRRRHPDVPEWDVRMVEDTGSMEAGTITDAYASVEGKAVWFTATYLGAGERKSRNDLAVVGDEVRYIESLGERERDEVLATQKVDYQSAILEDMAVPGRPRRIHADFYGHGYVDRFRRGQKLRVLGVYTPVAEKKKREIESAEQTFRYKVEVVRAVPMDDVRESWTEADLAIMRKSVAERGVAGHLKALTNSLAHVVRENHHAKLACLMSCVGGTTLPNVPHNIHTILVGDPGTGKSAIMQAALDILPNSILADAQGLSARGLTFGTEEWAGEKIVSAGLMVLYNHIGMEEVGEAQREHFAAIKEAMSSQVISYNVTNAKIRERVDCSLMLVGNPYSGVWDDGADWRENLRPIPSAIATRANCYRVELDDDYYARSLRMADAFLGLEPPEGERPEFTEAELAHWVDYASRQRPPYRRECREAITSFFKSFWGSRQKAEASSMAQLRLEVNAWRNSAAIAKLCGAPEVGKEHVLEAVEFFSASMRSIGVGVADAPTEFARPPARRESRRDAFTRILHDLDERHGIRGFDMMSIQAAMRRQPEHWPTQQHIDDYYFSPSAGERLRKDLLYQPRTADKGHYRLVERE